jgi:hypothetical protein
VHFVAEAIKHAKPVGGLGAGRQLIEQAANGAARVAEDNGTVPPEFPEAFHAALAQHRSWERPTAAIPARPTSPAVKPAAASISEQGGRRDASLRNEAALRSGPGRCPRR